MPTVPHPTRGVTPCTRCGAAIRWATCTSGLYKGRRVPLNALPSPMGGYAARYNQHGGITVRELDAEFPKAEDARLEWPVVIHWTSCPGGNNPQPPAVQQLRSRPARRRPTVQPPLWGTR